MATTFLTVIVIVYIVLFPAKVAREVEATVMAWPVGIGLRFVLLQGPVTWEPSFAAITICH